MKNEIISFSAPGGTLDSLRAISRKNNISVSRIILRALIASNYVTEIKAPENIILSINSPKNPKQ